MKIFIGADHRGFERKEQLKQWLIQLGHQVVDCGNTVYDAADDYPDFSFAVADQVVATGGDSQPGGMPAALGMVLCGSGVGVTVAANKVKGARCAVGYSTQEVMQGREDDDMNILALSAEDINFIQTKEIVEKFLSTVFKGDERHERRLDQVRLKEELG